MHTYLYPFHFHYTYVCICNVLISMMQFITFGYACTPLYFVWEKVIGMHETNSILLRAVIRLPVVIPIWFLAIIFPFFGPINSAVGALLVTFTVYIIPSLAHILTYRSASSRQNAAEEPPAAIGGWGGAFVVNVVVVVWVFVVGFGLGGWASMTNFIKQVDTFGLFAKCYQCPPRSPPPRPHHWRLLRRVGQGSVFETINKLLEMNIWFSFIILKPRKYNLFRVLCYYI